MRNLCQDKRKEVDERRKHKRFLVQNGAFAVLTAFFWPHSTQKLGHIIDIGLGGLAFSYITSEESPNGAVELSIFLAENRFYLRNIPFETMSVVEITEEPSSSLTTRRHSVQCGKIAPNQVSQLKYFIWNHTIG